MRPTHDTALEYIHALFDARGADAYFGEDVTIAEHMLQTAHFAEQGGAEETLIVAALLHDVGHLNSEFGDDYIEQGVDNRHENAGSIALSPFFPQAVTEPIRLHVAAKKYLCATAPVYYKNLSDASKRTLELQGGVMNEAQQREFESNAYSEAAVKLRYWDDAGKIPGLRAAELEHYHAMIERVQTTR